MKIIVLGTRGFPDIPGGVEKHCEDLYPRLAALGCEVTVIGRAPYTGREPYYYKGVYILPVACPKNKFLESIFHTLLGLFKAKQLQGDIVHIHAIGPSMCVPLARWLGLKVVMTHHGPDYERKKWNGFAKWVLKVAEQWGVTFAHQVIAISRGIASDIGQKFHRVPPVIPNGVAVSARSEAGDILKRYQLEKGKYVLAVGRFVPEKGFNDLVEGFRQLSSSERDHWKLVIVGDADHEDAFSREFKSRSRLTPGVVLTGFQTGKPLRELYSHSGLFVLPSYHEGLPIVLLEALSYGSSCLISDIPANREVGLEEERHFQPGDISLMTRKIRDFLVRPVSEDERRERIRKIIERYNWDQIARQTLGVYEQAAPQGARKAVSTWTGQGRQGVQMALR